MRGGTIPWFSEIQDKKENMTEIHDALVWEENEISKSPISGKRLVLSNNGTNIIPSWDSQITKTVEITPEENVVGNGSPVFDKPWCRYETPYTYNVNISEDLSNTEFIFQKFFP
ncbi:uncharacterized protein LOC106668439 [Cimex lectularius]|uniref:Uncharacterized protein n=1 Tax=Cimex lectularius TaxID=79782 RepID=A0A8I6RUP5_CIMLE|nr:uncharacterized protein LOC106668439 [Cimex lectularius]